MLAADAVLLRVELRVERVVVGGAVAVVAAVCSARLRCRKRHRYRNMFMLVRQNTLGGIAGEVEDAFVERGKRERDNEGYSLDFKGLCNHTTRLQCVSAEATPHTVVLCVEDFKNQE